MASDDRTFPHGSASSSPAPASDDDGDLTDMLGELRVLLPSAQLLSAFLITIPVNSGFAAIVATEKGVFIATFVLALASLVMLSAPAVQHRVIRPLTNRAHFTRLATRQIVLGSVALAMATALVLVTQLVLSAVFGHRMGSVAAGGIAGSIVGLWWVLPKLYRARGRL
ncbi:DUF6328 family protein [Piscinibacter koreensis]|uniref:Sodium:proton antiporter n=1 Tax=Piscinibacter koreensis TaxID=2742824 RepID=A0A7Y6NTN9_9BURK|nr:DUF6328 family protein [Schlegelella koreensis]NUZ09073.1 hypothetical protein [Schlegelella koreensis]